MDVTNETTIRLCYRRENGTIEPERPDYGLADFAGVLPSMGDQILDPLVLRGRARNELHNRRLLTVVGRVFNPCGTPGYVALVVEERTPTEAERALVG